MTYNDGDPVSINSQRRMSGITDQPPPIPNDNRPVVDMVMDDLSERKRIGIERYGTPLQVNNGRDMLVDLYQELMDAVIYIRGLIEERHG